MTPTPFDHLDGALNLARDSVIAADSEIPPDSLDTFRAFERWMASVFASARALRLEDGATGPRFSDDVWHLDRETIVTLARSDIFRPNLELHLLEEAGDRTFASFDRCLAMIPLLLARVTKPFTGNYLARVAQLYIWGFDPEVYVMCRAALESVLEDLMPDEHVRPLLGWKERAPVSLAWRIHVARYADPPLLSDRTWALACWLKDDGNEVVHIDPHLQLRHNSAHDAIKALVEVLESLPLMAGRLHRPPPDAPWRPAV